MERDPSTVGRRSLLSDVNRTDEKGMERDHSTMAGRPVL